MQTANLSVMTRLNMASTADDVHAGMGRKSHCWGTSAVVVMKLYLGDSPVLNPLHTPT